MPAWVAFLIQLALKYGLPWLESHVPARIAAIIEAILALLKQSPNQTAGLEAIEAALKSMKK